MKNFILEKFHQYNKNIFDDDEEMHIHFWQSIRQMSQWHLKSIGFSLVGIWIFKNIYCRKSCIKSYLCSLKSQCDQILCINGILFVYFTDNEWILYINWCKHTLLADRIFETMVMLWSRLNEIGLNSIWTCQKSSQCYPHNDKTNLPCVGWYWICLERFSAVRLIMRLLHMILWNANVFYKDSRIAMSTHYI